MFVLLYEIVARYLFHAPTLWAHETSRHFYGVQFIVAGAYALRYNRHINTDVLVGYLSTRKRAIVDSILWTVFIFYCIILLWQGAEMAWVSFLRRETQVPFLDLYQLPVGRHRSQVEVELDARESHQVQVVGNMVQQEIQSPSNLGAVIHLLEVI